MSEPDITSIHARRAVEGDDESVAWIIERFGGMLRSHARWRIGRGLGPLANEEDLVQEVWLRVLPKLVRIEARDGRTTPVLVRFLGSTLLNVCFEIQKRSHHGRGPLPSLADPASAGVVTHALRREQRDLVLEAIEALDPVDRSILILRLVEDVPNSIASATLDIAPSTATRRYQQALDRLRQRLPGSIFDELSEG